ncbi:MAG: Ornithine cyclodeaminase, partial [Hyphomicrobiales bacterium]|nr:Ornithine cyclodeaminase [Hyphomicrobiales bacterium]
EHETAALLTMSEVVETCEAVLREQGLGQASLSDPAAMFLAADIATPTKFKVKGGYLAGLGACGFRVVGDLGHDGDLGENHYCLLLDPVTAKPRGLIAQTELHRMRTAACGLVALKHLGAADMQTVALIGAGRIGAYFARGFRDIFPDKQLIVASRRIETARDLATETGAQAMTIADAVATAQGIVALTTATEPVMTTAEMRPGVTIVGMGEYHELPAGLLQVADRFFVDDLGFASVLGSLSRWLARGDTTREAAAANLDGTLGAIVARKAEGRRSPHEKVLAIVQGLAIADLALADRCRRKIQERDAAA